MTSKKRGVARAHGNISESLANLLCRHGAVGKAVSRLIANLDAKSCYFDRASGEMVTVDDGATQVKAAMGLLAYAVGEPLKRQQILTGQMPATPPTREEMRTAIDRKLAAQVSRDDVTVSELVAAGKALAESGSTLPSTRLTDEEQAERMARVLRLPPGRGIAILEKKRKAIEANGGEDEHPQSGQSSHGQA